jgi:hypothetical protein
MFDLPKSFVTSGMSPVTPEPNSEQENSAERGAGVVWADMAAFAALLGVQATLRLIRCGPDVG